LEEEAAIGRLARAFCFGSELEKVKVDLRILMGFDAASTEEAIEMGKRLSIADSEVKASLALARGFITFSAQEASDDWKFPWL
jgi:hypothetical protein